MRFFLLFLAALGSVVALAVAVGLGTAHLFRKGALDVRTGPDPLDLEVATVGDGRITLRRSRSTRSGDWAMPGTFGLVGEHAYHRVGEVIELHAAEVVREHLGGRGILVSGDKARLDSFVFEDDPEVAHGLRFETVQVESPLGAMPAWFVPGTEPTWVVLVHGKGANRRETLRALPSLVELGLPCLAITYRNDEEAPNSDDSRYGYGRHEWEDLEAAVRYALDYGANQVVLMGFSMGGAISLSFLEKSPLASSVIGVILDAPMLDLRETIALGATKAGVPRRVLPYTNRIASRRYGVDWEEVDYLKRASALTPPILLFHGDADGTVPVSTSDRLAEALPNLVTYVRIRGAGHVRGWNVDRERYTAAVRTFLTKVLSDERTVQATV